MSAAPARTATASGASPVVVPEGGRFNGLLSFEGDASVEGELSGEIVARGRLRLGALSRVRADVEVDELIVEGELTGDVRARHRVELRPTARVTGQIRAPRVALAEGSLLEGQCEIGASGAPGAARSEPQASEVKKD